jgi:hypothetical protein
LVKDSLRQTNHNFTEKEIFTFFILHSILHLKHRHTCNNLKMIYSKFDLISQFQNLMKSEIGYEHYFMNYYLYLPFSRNQEISNIVETFKIMSEMNMVSNTGMKKFTDNELQNFLNSVQIIFDKMKNISNLSVKEIKERLSLPNKKRNEITVRENLKNFEKIFPNYIGNYVEKFNDEKKESSFYDEKDEKVQHLIYGDFVNKNESVEIYLHQRTMKKVKYKKRDYDIIHPIDKELINKILENKENLFE